MADAASTSVPTPTSTEPTPSHNSNTPPPQKPAEPAPKAAQPPEFFEVKVNGRTIKMTRQEVIDNASMSHAANDKFNEARKNRQEVDRIIQSAKSNPIEALMDPALGLTKDQVRDAFEKWYAKEFIEPETLTEDQRKLRDYELKLKKYEDDEKEKKLNDERDAEEKMTTQQREYLQQQIVEAMESSGLPKTKFIAARVAFYMRQNLLNGWDAPLPMIIKQVKSERQAMLSDLISGSNVEQLSELFGEEGINKIRQHDLKQLREKRQLPPVTQQGNRAGTGPLSGERVYSSEVNRRLKDMRLGKV